MNYSRRQLEALGEPLGESVTRLKPGGRIYGGGGSGGGGGTSQQTTVQELPEWAKPYAQQTLAKAQTLTEQPYQTYEAPRIAGFSPLQQQAQQQAAGMAPAEQLGTATSLASAAGAGALGAGGYQPGQFYGGQFGTRQAAQYMNPFLEMSLAPQIAEAQRQSGIMGTQLAGQATQAGAFGGSRYGLQEAERQRNLGTNISNIVGQGYNQAFQQAQQQFNQDMARRMQAQQLGEQSRQFGANLGLQGLQTGLQAAGTLGNLGQTQFGQQMGINQLVNQYGQQQQALEQQGLSQAYQDFLNQQNYPYKQLGFMSDILKGTPTGQSTAMTMYQSPGSMLGQLGGLGLGAYGLSRLMAEGGEVHDYADGGSVTSSSFEESALERMRADDDALMRAKEAALARRDVDTANYIDKLLAENASVRSGLGNAFDQLPFSTQEEMMAGGGIVAFADRGAVKSDEPTDEEIEAAKKPFIGTPMIVRPRGKEYGESGFFKGLGEFLVPSTYAVEKKTPAAPSADEMAAFDRATADYMASRAKPATTAAAPTKTAPTDGGIKEALKVMSATHGLSEKTLMDNYTQMYDKLSAENKPLLERLNKAIEKSAGRADKARSEALPKALAEFGFQWAASAAKPGARFIGSAAAASPALAASAAESQKAIDKAEDAYNQLQMEQAKFEMALKKGDRATAMQHATNIRQLEVSVRQLNLQAQQIAQQGALGRAALEQRGTQFGQLMGVREKTAQAALAQAETARRKVESVARQKFEAEVAPRLNREFTAKYGKNWASLPFAQAEFNQKKDEYIGGQSVTPSATPFSSFGLSDTEMKYIFGTE